MKTRIITFRNNPEYDHAPVLYVSNPKRFDPESNSLLWIRDTPFCRFEAHRDHRVGYNVGMRVFNWEFRT